MKTIRLRYILYFLILLSSCSLDNRPIEELQESVEFYILQERNPKKLFSVNQEASIKPQRMTYNSIDNLLGVSYNISNFPITNPNNLGFQVLDLELLKEEHPGYFLQRYINRAIANSYSFYDFSRLAMNMSASFTNTIDFGINLILFEINSEITYKNSFSTSLVENTESIFGISTLSFNKYRYILNAPSADVLENLHKNYLCDDYLYMLHHTSSDQFVNSYGQFVLFDYTIGGNANALFVGQRVNNQSHSEIYYEEGMNNNISFFWNIGEENSDNSSDNSNGSYSEGSSITGGCDISSEEIVSNISYTVYTEGGLPAYNVSTSPAALGSSSINLTAWGSSLSNNESLVISEVPESSLVPITSFIEEDNLRDEIMDKITNGVGSSVLQEPKIQLYIYIDPTELKAYVGTNLKTRRGEQFSIRTRQYDLSKMDINTFTIQENERNFINKYFPDLEISARIQTGNHITRSIEFPITIPIKQEPEYHEFDVRYMRKLIDPRYGKLYLLCDTEDNEKYAYTLYDESIINDYTFSDFLDSIEFETELTIEQVREEYELIAL